MKNSRHLCALLIAAALIGALLCGTLAACGKPGGRAPLTGTYDGKTVFAKGYPSLPDVAAGTVIAQTADGVYQKIDLSGSVVAASSVDEMNAQSPAACAESSCIRSIENGLAPLFRGDKLGLFAEDGTVVIEPTWTVYRNGVQRVHLSEGRIVIGWGETESSSKLAILKVTASSRRPAR